MKGFEEVIPFIAVVIWILVSIVSKLGKSKKQPRNVPEPQYYRQPKAKPRFVEERPRVRTELPPPPRRETPNPPEKPRQIQSPLRSVFQGKNDLERMVIAKEILDPPLSIRT